MFLFRRSQSLRDSGIMSGYTDWHSHILPGVDDGVETMDEALQILMKYERLGVRNVCLTPHIMEDIPNSTAMLRDRFSELSEAYQRVSDGRQISLRLASENMIDSLFMDRLEQDDFLLLDTDRKCLLVETSYYNPPMNLYDTLGQVGSKGYNVVLAHPERYHYMDERDYIRLHEMNVKFQLNLMSLLGTYGKDVRSKAFGILSKGWYSISGSDIHSAGSLDTLLKGRLPENELNALMKIL